MCVCVCSVELVRTGINLDLVQEIETQVCICVIMHVYQHMDSGAIIARASPQLCYWPVCVCVCVCVSGGDNLCHNQSFTCVPSFHWPTQALPLYLTPWKSMRASQSGVKIELRSKYFACWKLKWAGGLLCIWGGFASWFHVCEYIVTLFSAHVYAHVCRFVHIQLHI